MDDRYDSKKAKVRIHTELNGEKVIADGYGEFYRDNGTLCLRMEFSGYPKGHVLFIPLTEAQVKMIRPSTEPDRDFDLIEPE